MPRYSHKLFSAGFTFLLCVCSSYAISSYILLRTSHMFSPVNRGHHENLGNVRNTVAMKPQTAQRHYGTSFPLFSVRRTRSAVSSLRTDEKNNGDTDGGYPLRTGSDIVRQSFSRSDGKVCLIFFLGIRSRDIDLFEQNILSPRFIVSFPSAETVGVSFLCITVQLASLLEIYYQILVSYTSYIYKQKQCFLMLF